MAYEELPMPDYALPLGARDADETIDFILTSDVIDTAFTDFSSHEKFQVDYADRHWSDSDALFACMKRALDNGIPVLDGAFLARVTRRELETDLRRQYRTAHAGRENGSAPSGRWCARR